MQISLDIPYTYFYNIIPIEVYYYLVPTLQSTIWSLIALEALIIEVCPFSFKINVPLPFIISNNYYYNHVLLINLFIGYEFIVAKVVSGNWDLWFPHTITPFISFI